MEGIQVALVTCTERRAWDPQPVKSEAAHTVASGVKHFQDVGLQHCPSLLTSWKEFIGPWDFI